MASVAEFDPRDHPRDRLGMFVHAPVTVDPKVMRSLRAQAAALFERPQDAEPDHTPWRERVARAQAEMDRLGPEDADADAQMAAVIESRRRPDGTAYLAPGPGLRQHEKLLRDAGGALDEEIRARIGDPPEEVVAGAERQRLMLRTFTGLAARAQVLRQDVLDEVLAAGVPPEEATPLVERLAPERRPELTEIDRRLVAAHDAIVRHANATVTARSLYSARYVLEMTALVGEARSLGGKLDVGVDSSSGPAQALCEAAERLPTDWVEASNAHEPALNVRPTFDERGFYDRRSGDMGIPEAPDNLSGDHVAVSVHEAVHRFADANPSLTMSEWAFLHRRIEGPDGHPQPPQRLDELTGSLAYAPDEMCCPDHFANPYTGRVFDADQPGDPLEVMAVGMESLYTGGNGIYEDADLRHFVLGVLVIE